ncbi:MAG: hypothetical protein QGH13_00955 [Candidatus Thalassarchaeaceae archaeon]|jgi:hypothetical protein|nr:hypothetical protein [Candidatus Thalassarchaeaceae archaeon]
MATCRYCRGAFPQDQFITGNGPRYLVCVRCGVEQGFVSEEETPQLYSDELVRGRTALYARRYGIWMSLFVGWSIFLVMGQGIELWSRAIFIVLIISTILVPIRHFLGTPRFKAEESRLTP